MARLTWENVAAPDLGSAARILETGFQGFANGANGIADTLLGIRERQKNNRSAAAFDVLAGVRSEGDVSGALAQIASMVSPQDRSKELTQAMMALRDGALGYDSSRANTRATTDANNRQNVTHERGIRKEDQLGRAGAAMAGGFREALGQSESGGNYNVVNDEGFVGKYQWGQARLDDYNRATGMNFTLEDIKNPRIAEAAQAWHEQDILKDLGQYAGTRVNGQVLDDNAIVAMAHLGGKGGARQYIESGGRYDPADSNGTNLSDYARKFGNSGDWMGTIGEGNLISPEEFLGLATSEQSYFDDRERNADENRKRDEDFLREQAAKELARQGQSLATQVLGQAAYADDVGVLINRSDVPTEVKQAAFAFLRDNPELASTSFQMPYDPNASGPAGSGEAMTAIDSALAVQENQIKSDNSLRIQAEGTKYESDPAAKLIANMPELDGYDRGELVDTIKSVVSQVNAVDGYSITDGQAAALLKESAEEGGWFIGNGKVRPDADAAVKMALDLLSPEQIAASSERMSQYEMSKAALEKDKADLSKVGQALLLAQSQPNPDQEKVARLQKDYDALYESVMTRARPAPANEEASAEPSRPANASPAREESPEVALQAAEVRIAANAIVRATDGQLTPDRLASMPQDQQLMVLGGVLDQLIAQNAPSAEIEAVQGVIQAVQAQKSAGVNTTVPRPAQPAPVEPQETAPAESSVTFREWQNMSRSERERQGLPTSLIGAQIHFSRLLGNGS